MAIKLLRRYRFTCTSVSRSAPNTGIFSKGQVLIINEDDPRLAWFRSGGFTEEALPAVEVDDGQPAPTAAPKGDDPPDTGGDGGGGDDNIATPDTPLIEVAGIRSDAAQKLEEAGIITVANALSVGFDGLTAVPGIGEKTAQSIMDICKLVVGE